MEKKMNISSVGNSQYVQAAASVQNTSSKTEGTSSKVSSNNSGYQIEGLDERGNAILNLLLVGKSERDKDITKAVVDGMMLFDFKLNSDGTVTSKIKKDTSEEAIIAKLDEKVRLNKSNNRDPFGINQIVRQLRDMYKSGYSPLDMKA
jgi:hypothetical protein